MNIEMIETFLDLCENAQLQPNGRAAGGDANPPSRGVCARLEQALGCRLPGAQPRGHGPDRPRGLRFCAAKLRAACGWRGPRRGQAVRGNGRAGGDDAHRHPARPSGRPGSPTGSRRLQRRGAGYGALCSRPIYSAQMCADVRDGALDDRDPLPRPSRTPTCISKAWARSPMSTRSRPRPPADLRRGAAGGSYILPNYAPRLFSATHAERPADAVGRGARSRAGQNAVISGPADRAGRQHLCPAARTARDLERGGAGAAGVGAGPPLIDQPVLGRPVHLRNRHRGAHRRLLRALKAHLDSRPS